MSDMRRWFGGIVMLVVGPLIDIVAFNHFFNTNIPITFESWVLVFLVGILAVVVVFGVMLLFAFGGAIISEGISVLLIFASLFLIPVFFIWAFNVLMHTAVPVTLESYAIVGLVMIGGMLLSGILKGGKV